MPPRSPQSRPHQSRPHQSRRCERTAEGQRPSVLLPVDPTHLRQTHRTYGKPIAEWKQLIRATGITKHLELVNWLKTEHGMGHGHANSVVGHTLAELR